MAGVVEGRFQYISSIGTRLSQRHRGIKFWFVSRNKPGLNFWLMWEDEPRNLGLISFIWAVPLWLPLLLIAAPTAYLWYTDRRAKPWQCAKCRYDLRGIEGGVCPECGVGIGAENELENERG